MNDYLGMPIIFSQFLTDSVMKELQRTWRQRLFSWPWTPWRRTYMATVQVPSRRVVLMNGKMVIHPAMVDTLKAEGLLDVRIR